MIWRTRTSGPVEESLIISRQLQHCALSVISLLRLDKSHPTHDFLVTVRDGFKPAEKQNTHAKTHMMHAYMCH